MTDVDLNLLVPEDENLEEPNEVEILMSLSFLLPQ